MDTKFDKSVAPEATTKQLASYNYCREGLNQVNNKIEQIRSIIPNISEFLELSTGDYQEIFSIINSAKTTLDLIEYELLDYKIKHEILMEG